MDELTRAVVDAGTELGTRHGWVFDGSLRDPTEDGLFTTTMLKHIRPLLGDVYRQARIAALKAELAELAVVSDGAAHRSRCVLVEAMETLSQIPQGGVGENGATVDEIEQAEGRGRCVDDDATYHIVQKAWWMLRSLLGTKQRACRMDAYETVTAITKGDDVIIPLRSSVFCDLFDSRLSPDARASLLKMVHDYIKPREHLFSKTAVPLCRDE